MAYQLKYKLFSFFGVNAKRRDTFKDGNGKGIWERYNESVGEGYDDELSDLIDNVLDNVVVPKKMKAQLIPLMEIMLGGIVNISDSVSVRRKLIQWAHAIYNIKGTVLCHEVLFRLLGFNSFLIEELYSAGTFDTGTFDDPNRRFDSNPGCGCGKYRITLDGDFTVTPQIQEYVNRVIEFNRPINAEIIEVVYTGGSSGIFDDSFDFTFE